MTDTVLVTGGSGFVAGWCIERLLRAAYHVNATIRDLQKETAVRTAIGAVAPEAGDRERLRFFASDLLADAGWAKAMGGCRYVLHVASPLTEGTDEELIPPARDGTLRVLKAAVAAGVERVVYTSTVGAIAYGHPEARYASGNPFDENDWSDENGGGSSAYIRSKIVAEKAAWAFMRNQGGSTQFVVVNPAGIFGPAMSADFSNSLAIVGRMLKGSMPALPPIGFSVVDVRDLADLHLLVMTRPEAAGRRFPAGGRFLWMADVAAILRAELPPEMTAKVPTRKAPAWALRIVGLWDKQIASLNHMLNRTRALSQDAALGLGWTPRPPEVTLKDTALSLKAVGAL